MWIQPVPVEKATGLLKKLYDDAVRRVGRVFGIRRVMSVNPEVLRDSVRFYATVMMGESPLSRAEREMLATVVAVALECRY